MKISKEWAFSEKKKNMCDSLVDLFVIFLSLETQDTPCIL